MLRTSLFIYFVFTFSDALISQLDQSHCYNFNSSQCYGKKEFEAFPFSITLNDTTWGSAVNEQGVCPFLFEQVDNCRNFICIKNYDVIQSYNDIGNGFGYGEYANVDWNNIAVGNIHPNLWQEQWIVHAKTSPPNPNNTQQYSKLSLQGVFTRQWVSNATYTSQLGMHGGMPGLCDFNQDGIPEVYMANMIFNARTGVLLAVGGQNGKGTLPNGVNDFMKMAVAGDFDDNPSDLELAAGYTIYDVIIANPNGMLGNSMVANNLSISGKMYDGYTACADINVDGKLDAVVASVDETNTPILYAYHLDNGVPTLIASSTILGGFNAPYPMLPVISNHHKGEKPIIFITRDKMLNAFSFDGSTIFKTNYTYPLNGHGCLMPTVFDFNNDGIHEIVVTDSLTLQILHDENNIPINIATKSCKTKYPFQRPIVGDLFFNFSSVICAPCESYLSSQAAAIYIFGTADTLHPWAPARNIWNQMAFNPVQIKADGTIPQYQPNQATYQGGRYNNFNVQASLLDSNGMYRAKAAGLYGEIMCVDYDFAAQNYTVTFNLYNKADASLDVDAGLDVAFYDGHPETNGKYLGTYTTTQNINAGTDRKGLTYTINSPSLTKLFMVVNTTRSTNGSLVDSNFVVLECDYTDNVYQYMLPAIQSIDTTICGGNTYSFFGQEIISAGQYFHKFKNSLGCDSILIMIDVDFKPSFTIDLGEDKNICPSESTTLSYSEPYDQLFWLPKGRVSCDTCTTTTLVGRSDTLISLFVVRDGCISTDTIVIDYVEMDLVSLGPDSRLCPGLLDSFIIKVPYDSLVWSPSSMVSCDTCRAIQLLGSDDFELSILAYTQGCETSDTVSIDYIQRVNETRRIDLCDGDTFTYGSESWSQSGTYTYAVGQCDSLLTFDIRTHTSVIRDQVASICAGDSLRFGSQWLTSAGNYTQTLQTTVGCDSTIRLQLSLLPTPSIANTIQVCAGKVTKIHGIDRNAPGVFNQTFSSAVGCDSTSIITLTWAPPIAYRDTMMVCAGKPVPIHGIVRTTQGLYAQAFKTTEGCDSTAAILLTYEPPITYRDTIGICASESATIHGTVRTTQGLYSQDYKTGQGCDSTAAIYLSISPYKVTDRSFKLCDRDSIIINNRVITKAGIVIDTFKVSTGCDEIIKNTVSLLLPSISPQTNYLCPDSVIRLDNGQIIDKPGVFNITGFKNAAGCDSTVVLTVQDVPRPPQPTLQVDCETEQYSIIAPKSEDWFYGDPLGQGLDTLIVPKIGGVITIPVGSIYFCNYKSFQFNLPPIPDISDIPTISDQQQTTNSGISLTIALDPSQWRVAWFPSTFASCDTCLNTIISTPVDTTIGVLLTHISGCQFTQSFRISRTPNISFDIPNIINLSSQGGNETWRWTVPTSHSLLQCSVYDRWGNAVYFADKTDQNISWDGHLHSQPVAQGVYVYIIKVIDSQGNVTILKGDVTVVK